MFRFFTKSGNEKTGSYKTLSDTELISIFKLKNDQLAFSELFKRYSHLVLGICLKYLKNEEDSKDAVMQIFEKLMTDLQKHEPGNFRAWLYTVSKNHCLMILRKVRVEYPLEDKILIKAESEVVELDNDLHLLEADQKEIGKEQLEMALNQLNTGQKECVELFYLKNQSYKEIAEVTGYSMDKVKSYIQNGKRNLGIILTKLNG